MVRLATMTATIPAMTTSSAVTTTIIERRRFLAPSNGMIETGPAAGADENVTGMAGVWTIGVA